MTQNGHMIEILLVEDNPGDIELTREAFSDSKICNTVHTVCDGEAALDFLYQRGAYRDAVRPDVILLDINLPKRDGKEVLEVIKNDAMLKEIPVVMLTSSETERDILRSYQLHANCYIAKPVNLDNFMDVVRSIEGFWLSVVRLPSSRSNTQAAA